MDILYHIMTCAVTGLFAALFVVLFAAIGIFPVAIIDIKDTEEDEGE